MSKSKAISPPAAWLALQIAHDEAFLKPRDAAGIVTLASREMNLAPPLMLLRSPVPCRSSRFHPLANPINRDRISTLPRASNSLKARPAWVAATNCFLAIRTVTSSTSACRTGIVPESTKPYCPFGIPLGWQYALLG